MNANEGNSCETSPTHLNIHSFTIFQPIDASGIRTLSTTLARLHLHLHNSTRQCDCWSLFHFIEIPSLDRGAAEEGRIHFHYLSKFCVKY